MLIKNVQNILCNSWDRKRNFYSAGLSLVMYRYFQLKRAGCHHIMSAGYTNLLINRSLVNYVQQTFPFLSFKRTSTGFDFLAVRLIIFNLDSHHSHQLFLLWVLIARYNYQILCLSCFKHHSYHLFISIYNFIVRLQMTLVYLQNSSQHYWWTHIIVRHILLETTWSI